MNEQGQLFELRRVRGDTPQLFGLEFIEVEAKTVINRVPGNFLPFRWTINPYRGCSHACVYCFARPTHVFLDMNAGHDFESRIVVKVNVAGVLRSQLARKGWKGEHIAMGTNTDPYQAAEGRYRLMPGVLRALIDFRNPFSILSKGTMMLRDLDLLLEASDVTDVHTSYSIGTVDEAAWRKTEPGTPHPLKRVEAVRQLNAAGIPCGVLMAPILPGISDSPAQLRATAAKVIAAGATHVNPMLLHLKPGVKEEFMAWLEREFPDKVGDYQARYQGRAYANPADRANLDLKMRRVLAGLPLPRRQAPGRFAGRRRWIAADAPRHRTEAEQLGLL
ncbi:MAG: radical SAM protein [Candidatus Dormibacteraeota bacterium]|nr:radical SAM protein [Candidatus Dormibacteraeota bacterium]